jgi:hypothetical protein
LPNGLHLVPANTFRLADKATINTVLAASRWLRSFWVFFFGISFSDLLVMFEPMPTLRGQLASAALSVPHFVQRIALPYSNDRLVLYHHGCSPANSERGE